jgi:putative ABC transport system permease protein
MSLWRVVLRSLRFYWRTNLGVLLATVVGTGILTGALAVGDSVRHSLKSMVTARLGGTKFALVAQSRFFRSDLAEELQANLGNQVASVLRLRGLISNSSGTRRANRIRVLGVDRRFFEIGPGADPFGGAWSEAAVVNQSLAEELDVAAGDEVVLRFAKPGLMPRDVPITPDSDLTVASRLTVKAVAAKADFGNFSLQANQLASFNAFVPMQWLQDKLGRSSQANMLLVATDPERSLSIQEANTAIDSCWKLADAGLEIRNLESQQMFELRSKRVFIDRPVAEFAMKAADEAIGVLVYFANEIRLGKKATPYSMVAAVGPAGRGYDFIPADMQDDEILINQWLADDLDAQVGDSIALRYYVIGPTRRLQEEKAAFRIRKILPMEPPVIDSELMPEFPGLADANNCRDWDPSLPVDLDRIRSRDEQYWDLYRGAPKAFITLSAGRKLWANRYGNLTAVRYPAAGHSRQAIAESLLRGVDPASVGLFFQPVRERGLKAATQATDFGQLFLGLSMFLIAASLALLGLLFAFGIESRSDQIGILRAVGFSPGLARMMLLLEGGMLAVLGALGGAAAGLLYTKVMIYGLTTVWQGAVGGSAIEFHARPSTLCIGAVSGMAVSVVAMWLALRKQVTRPARELLAGDLQWQFFTSGQVFYRGGGVLLALISVGGAVVLLALIGGGDSQTISMTFFGAGALLLVAGLGLTYALLSSVAGGWRKPFTSLAGLGLRNTTRRSGRSLAVVGLLACGTFLVIAVGANRQDPTARAGQRHSGTGGFALYGESAIPVLYDLNTESGKKSLRLEPNELQSIEAVQMRVYEGDNASCLNLNRAQNPRLLGVDPEQLQKRDAFAFRETIDGAATEDAWRLLQRFKDPEVVPAIGDYPTIIWSLGKAVGDEIEYIDENGRKFRVRIVAMLESSILQGSLLISEDRFVDHFPSEEGYEVFLFDVPEGKAEQVSRKLAARLQDYGLALVSAEKRLQKFSAVQNTYLSIFQLLGGLGLVLGTIGLGLVVLRNILERRGELAMLKAVGFTKAKITRMVFYEHWGLLLAGLLFGLIAALLAVKPALASGGGRVPYVSLILVVAAIAVSGILWIRVATALALRGEMLDALRNE